MEPEQIASLGPALTEYLGSFRNCLGECRLMGHFATYCRGLLSNLLRKSVEPMALAAGGTVRALQMFLSDRVWEHLRLRDRLQQRVVRLHAPVPGAPAGPDGRGVIGLIDETSVAKKGDQTPGVKRQYLGSVGKLDNGIVTVHLGYVHGDFKALLDSNLFLPEDWAADRDRCRRAKIPEDLPYRPKTRIAVEQVRRALGNGLRFDWLVFDEGYGKDPSFLFDLDALGQTWIGEVPKNFHCWPRLPQYHSGRREFASKEVYSVVRWSPAFVYQPWETFAFPRETVAPAVWDVKAGQVYLVQEGRPTDRTYWLIVAWDRATDEYKYFLSNAPPRTRLDLLLNVAFRRAVVEHLFRLAKDQVGFDHFEGRSYVGLMRHMILCQLILLFVAEQTQRLNAERAVHAPVSSLPVTTIGAATAPTTLPSQGEKTGRQIRAEKPQGFSQAPAADLDSHSAACHHGTGGGLAQLGVCPVA
jgi:SRSO17 transposase